MKNNITLNPPASALPAHEINQLHEEVIRQTDASKKCLNTALVAAWKAGQLLLGERKRVRRTMGAAWGFWLEANFRGTHRTAQHYMRLAETVPDVSAFQGLSLRQVYFRLGIATESKSRADSPQVAALPAHIRLASKLVAALKTLNDSPAGTPERRALLCLDLRPLYNKLRGIFEADCYSSAPPPSDTDFSGRAA
jgi:hypothetical protein